MGFGNIVQAVLLVGFISIFVMALSRSRRKVKLLKKYGVSPVIRFKNGFRVKGGSKSLDVIKDKIQPEDKAEYNGISRQYKIILALTVSLLAFIIVSSVLHNIGII